MNVFRVQFIKFKILVIQELLKPNLYAGKKQNCY